MRHLDLDEDCDGHAHCGGAPLWGCAFGGSGEDDAFTVASDSEGNEILGGLVTGVIDFGAVRSTSAARQTASSSSSTPRASTHGVCASATNAVRSVAVDSDDNIYVSGMGTSDIGGVEIAAPGDGVDILMARFDADGQLLWTHCFAAGSLDFWDQTNHIAVAPDGSLRLMSKSGSAVDLGGGPLGLDNAHNLVFARFDADGGHAWTRSFFARHAGGMGLDAEGGLAPLTHVRASHRRGCSAECRSS